MTSFISAKMAIECGTFRKFNRNIQNSKNRKYYLIVIDTRKLQKNIYFSNYIKNTKKITIKYLER